MKFKFKLSSLPTWSQFKSALSRRKIIQNSAESKLAKVLTTLDLTALGVGSTLGVGVYVLAGQVSKNTAGPSVILSFLIAAVASMFSGLCYAEFGARVPKAGSAYVYSYVSVGEFVAFIIGWNLILEYVIGSASVVKGLFTYLDALVNKEMSIFFRKHMPIDVEYIGEYPDFFSFGITILFTFGIALGAKESSVVNSIFTVLNLIVVIVIIASGFWKVDIQNWKRTAEEAAIAGIRDGKDYGTGGFMPYGFSGIIKGAAKCFYGFVGFDVIATAGEEAKDPKKSIPISVVVSLIIIFLAYFGISLVLTMMLPYYDQDADSPFPHVYDKVDWPIQKWIVSVGAMFGLFASLLGAMFPLPRIIYAMSIDGLLFEIMGRINQRFQTPFYGTLFAGVFTAILSAIFALEDLFSMMSIGTLLAYSMVSACVLLLRYAEDVDDITEQSSEQVTMKALFQQTFNRKKLTTPTPTSSVLVVILVILFCIFSFGLAAILLNLETEISDGHGGVIAAILIFAAILITMMVIVNLQPRSKFQLSFGVPFVPWLPLLSIAINIYLMIMLDILTWVRFGVWIIIGLILYFSYGIRYSKERYQTYPERLELQPKEVCIIDEQAKTEVLDDIEIDNKF